MGIGGQVFCCVTWYTLPEMTRYCCENKPHVFRCTECSRYFRAWLDEHEHWHERPAKDDGKSGTGICQGCVGDTLVNGANRPSNQQHPFKELSNDGCRRTRPPQED